MFCFSQLEGISDQKEGMPTTHREKAEQRRTRGSGSPSRALGPSEAGHLGSACTQAFLKLRTQGASPAQPNNYLFPGTGRTAPANLAPVGCGCQDGVWPNCNQCCQVSCRHCPEFQRHYPLLYSSWHCSVGFLFHGDLA